jgi:hypothetical protein
MLHATRRNPIRKRFLGTMQNMRGPILGPLRAYFRMEERFALRWGLRILTFALNLFAVAFLVSLCYQLATYLFESGLLGVRPDN